MPRLSVWVRYKQDDPLYHLHVPRRARLTEDVGGDSDAVDAASGDDGDFDRDAVRDRGGVVDQDELT